MKQLFAVLLFLSFHCGAQTLVKGMVKDRETGKVLAFASIKLPDGTLAIADVDGKFLLKSHKTQAQFAVSSTGYTPENTTISANRNFYTIQLTRLPESLRAVRVENPANTIVRKVIAFKKNNDPQKRLSSFRFSCYNKLIISAPADSIRGTISFKTVKNHRKDTVVADSANYKFKKLISRQHLFQMEKLSDFAFDGNKLKQTVRAAKMAGLEKPVYEAISFNQQSFSLYGPRYELFETQYKGPLANDALNVYRFRLIDSTEMSGRPVWIIAFAAKKNTKKSPGLKGVLYIDKANFGIAKAAIRIQSVLDLTGEHSFEYVPSVDLWFPSGRKFKIVKGHNDEDIRIFGETLVFDVEEQSRSDREKQASDFTYLLSESRYFDRDYNEPVRLSRSSVAIEIKDEAVEKAESFWTPYRDSLDLRSAATYHALDSLSQKKRIEERLHFGRKIINGYVPVGPIDFDLRYLLSYNNFEGFRVGMGGVTNEKLSSKFRMEGYGAYGTKDGVFKYNAGAAVRAGRFSDSWMGAAYTDDVREIANTSFAVDKRVYKIYDPRPMNVSTFYNHKTWRGYLETKIIPKTESIWQLTHSSIDPLFDYTFYAGGKSYRRFDLTTAMVSLQWNPFSDYMQTPSGKFETDKRFPRFTFQFTQSLRGVWKDDFSFNKFDVRAEYEFKYLDGERTSFLIEGGYANGDVPLTHLYNTSPNNLTKERVMQRITFAGKNSFETMYFNEFFSSKYALFQVKHGLRRLKLFRKVKPEPVFVTRAAWGDMAHPERHQGIAYKTLERGYFESGLELNKIFSGFGLTVFYRYGPNGLPHFEDNLAIKLAFTLDLGF